MAYEPIKDGIIKNINTRKEFYSLRLPQLDFSNIVKSNKIKHSDIDNIIPRFILEKEIKRNNFLQLHSYQKFVKNFINPNTPYNRLLIKWETGTGKTIGAIAIAMSFIDYYRREMEHGSLQIGSVFIIGFTKQIFKNELLKYPELGFINREELQKFKKLTKLVSRGTKSDINNLRDFIIKVRKRFSNRRHNGFFKFYGYKEFVNKIFLPREKNININLMTEEEILEGLDAGKIKFNEELLESFTNSLIICDEIHNVYNSADKNNWGIALQSVLDNVPSIRALFLSATPINNSSTEVIDLLNLLIQSKTKLQKEDFFSNIKTGTLKSGALDRIKKLSMGRISFIKDINPLYFPSKTYLGVKIPDIDYLRFNRCIMSPFQYDTYKAIYTGTISQDSQYIIDFALPDPKYGIPKFDKEGNPIYKPNEIGMYQTKQIKTGLMNASQEWKDKIGLDWENEMIVGDALEKNRLKFYSNKFYTMITDVQQSIISKRGKIFIYHNIVHISGVLFIQEILEKNGIIMLGSTPTQNTLCTHDGLTLEEHSKKKIKDHEFNPVRFIVAHSEIERTEMNKQIQRFNDPDNAEGHDIMIIVGSKIIKEAYDIKAVQNVYIMGRPDNIPTLIQIIGRTVRKNSHIDLPQDQRNVNINIFTSCLPLPISNFKKILPRETHGIKISKYQLSYEEIKYQEKIQIFKIIQQIERKFHEGAIDMPVNMSLMFNKEGHLRSTDPLGPLNFTPDYEIPKSFKISDMITSTFEAFHEDTEMNIIISLIKRLFIEVDIAWTYNQLWYAVKNPPETWEINTNTHIFDEGNFRIALTRITWYQQKKYIEPIIKPKNYDIAQEVNIYEQVIDIMMDPNDKLILLPNGQASVIVSIGIYYCLLPLNMDTMEPIIDIEMPYRTVTTNINKNINVKAYLDLLSPTKDFPIKKRRFIQKYQYQNLINMEDAICDYGADFHQLFIEEIIEYVFNLLTGKGKMTRLEIHEFYFKMLYYYDIMGIVIWANTVKDFMKDKYNKYVSSSIPIKNIEHAEKQQHITIKNKSDVIKMLESSINTAGNIWVPEPVQKQYISSVVSSLEEFSKPRKVVPKPPANRLPIGHFIPEIPRFYDPNSKPPSWIDVPSYINRVAPEDWKENDLIIGFDDKSRTGLHIRFKIRAPVQNIKIFKDSRKIEKGCIATSKSKNYLIKLATDLEVELPKKINVINLSNVIRQKLIYNEIKERNTPGSKKKWFYMYYEKQPTF